MIQITLFLLFGALKLSASFPRALPRSYSVRITRPGRLFYGPERFQDLSFDDLPVDANLVQSSGFGDLADVVGNVVLPLAFATGTALALSGRLNFKGNAGPLSAENLASSPPPPVGSPLVGTRWELLLDFGREKNTWMPPTWAASGRRIQLPLLVCFEANGTVTPLSSGAFLEFPLAPGRWRVQGEFPDERLQLWLDTGGYSRGDNELPAGPLYFSTAVFGPQLSKKEGIMSIEAMRFFVRRERRMVGTFRAIGEIPLEDKLPLLPTAKIYFDKARKARDREMKQNKRL